MVEMHEKYERCAICKLEFLAKDLQPAAIIRNNISSLIRKDIPSWTNNSFICLSDLGKYRHKYVHSLVESEKGELTSLEQEVLKSLQEHDLLSKDIDSELDLTRTFGQCLADKIATFGGSWLFLILFFTFLFLWILTNSLVALWKPVDPYPFILLNLLLSCIAAIQAPIIMMSANRREAKDRIRSQHDYQINLKAELEIRHLHEKLDHLLSHQWERLVQIQELQIELLSEINRKNPSK